MEEPKVTIDEENKLVESKQNLRELRANSAKWAWESDAYTDFEQTYGKYLLLPFAIPIIQPKSMDRFLEFFFTKSKDAVKIKADMLSDEATKRSWSPYRQITSVSGKHSDIWSDNQQPEIYTQFPELFEQIHEYMPFIDRPDFKWFMWSANKDVPAHRDYGSQIDAPVGIRIMLYDDNPVQSLSLKVDPIDKPDYKSDYYPIVYPKEETNTFAWNNLRQKHASFYTKGHRKILMIVSAKEVSRIVSTKENKKRLNQYVDLLDRSISKYKDYAVIDTDNDYRDYLAFDGTEPINKVMSHGETK